MVSAAIFGEEGDDDNNLMGEGGDDYIEEYACNDVISDGLGSDDIWAGSGSDKITLKSDNGGSVETVVMDDTMSVSTFNITNYKNGGKTNLMPLPHLSNQAHGQHIMLLYDSDDERKATAADYINEGLKNGQLCIYASVGAYDSASKWHYSNLSSKIENFEENVKQGNLVIIDFKPLFEAARKGGDPTLFNQLKSQIETLLKQCIAEGKGDKLIIFADAACTLSKNKEFEECIELEGWWHGAHQEWAKSSSQKNITIICPHPAAVFNEERTAQAKAQLAAVHSVMLEAPRSHYYQQQHQAAAAVARRPIRVLIAEPEEDIQMLYRVYLDSLGLEVTIVSDADKCLESVFSIVDSEGFDMFILDTHLKDISGIEVARKIKQRLPDQRIIITSTTTSADEIERVGISRDDILYKPFGFRKLLGLIKPEK